MTFKPSRARRQRRLIVCRCLAGFITAAVLGSLFLPSSAVPFPSPITARSDDSFPKWTRHPDPSSNQVPIIPSPSDLSQIQTSSIFSHAKDESLFDQITQLGSLIDDEIHATSLLSPFLQSGTAHFRDLAIRTRLFKQIFSSWESLHLGHVEGDLGAANLIPHLRALQLDAADLSDAITTYDRTRSFINRLAQRLFPWTSAYYPDHMALHSSFYDGGRGVVMTAGNAQAQYLFTAIPALRRLGCTLPIEVLYLGDSDLVEEKRDALAALPGVVVRDLAQMIDDREWGLRGWAAKPFAILMSSFREVVFIDADSLFMQDPEVLFESEQYRETGALFFRDRNVHQGSKREWMTEILPRPFSRRIRSNRLWTGESVHMQESGVVVVDKWRHFVALLLTTRLNGPDRDVDPQGQGKGMYTMVFGDKETFWLSWEMAGDVDYAFHDGLAGNMGKIETLHVDKSENVLKQGETSGSEVPSNGDELNALAQGSPTIQGSIDLDVEFKTCSPQLVHFDLDGRPLWFNGWLATDKFRSATELEYISFEGFMREAPEIGGPNKEIQWVIGGNNVVCLTSKNKFEFTEA